MQFKHLAAITALTLATAAAAQVSHYRGADGALYVVDPNPVAKPPVAASSATSSPYATCTKTATATTAAGPVIRCSEWTFGPSKQQRDGFGKGPRGDSQFNSRPAL